MSKEQGARSEEQYRKGRTGVLLFFIVFYTLYAIPYTLSYAGTLSSDELIENARSIDGTAVSYQGEIVTTVLNRGEYSWVNLNDGRNAIGVWCKTQDLTEVKFVGSYKHKGDILEVDGVFNRACPLHGGELDIHADKVKVSEEGYSVEEKVGKAKRNISITLFLITLSLVVIFRRRI